MNELSGVPVTSASCAVLVIFQAEINRSYTKHRKIASSFRDTQLFEIFELGVNLLKKAYEMIKTVDYSDADQVSPFQNNKLYRNIRIQMIMTLTI